MASLSWVKAMVARSAIDCALSSAPRSDQSLSVVKASAAFWPLPEKLKPRIRVVLPTPGSVLLCASICAATCSVRARLAPGGNWISVMV
ncbi:hypothetical protein D3C84_920730 [compost metagenome]